jgi:hypothetical protein
MFEYLYTGSLITAAREHPREAVALAVAVLVLPEMHKRYTEVQLAKIRSANDVEIARLEKEAAELKYKTAQLYAVESPTQQ